MDITLLFPLLLVLLLIPLFLNGRRQRRQMQDMQRLQASLTPGDEVMTTSGLRATVVDASDPETVELEIAPDVTTIWVRAAIREKINPVDAEDAGYPGEHVNGQVAEGQVADPAGLEPKASDAPAGEAEARATTDAAAAKEATAERDTVVEPEPRSDAENPGARSNGRA